MTLAKHVLTCSHESQGQVRDANLQLVLDRGNGKTEPFNPNLK